MKAPFYLIVTFVKEKKKFKHDLNAIPGIIEMIDICKKKMSNKMYQIFLTSKVLTISGDQFFSPMTKLVSNDKNIIIEIKTKKSLLG